MLDAPLRRVIDPPLDRLGRGIAARGVRADAVTLAGFGLGVCAIAAIARGAFGWGLALLLANRALDGLDGAVARARGVTDLGGYLDIVLDFLVYAGVVFAFALADPEANALAAAFLVTSFMGTGSTFLAFAVMAAMRGLDTGARGRKSLYYLGGLTEGSETIAVFVAFCLWPAWFPALAWAFGALCWVTTATRILAAIETLGGAAPRA